MKIRKPFLTLALAVTLAIPASSLFAQEGGEKKEGCKSCSHPNKGGAQRFEDMDTDKDGKLTEAELVAAHQKRVTEIAKKQFSSMDLDENGVVTATEMRLVTSRDSSNRNGRRGYSYGRGYSRGHRGGDCKGRSCGSKMGECDGCKKSGDCGCKKGGTCDCDTEGGSCKCPAKDDKKAEPEATPDVVDTPAPAAESTEAATPVSEVPAEPVAE